MARCQESLGCMNNIAIALVIVSAAMHALRNFMTKQAADKQAFVWWYEVFGQVFFTPVFLYSFMQHGLPSADVIWLILFSGIVHFGYWVVMAKALEHGDLSLVYPIMRSSPALVLLISAIFLSEPVSIGGIAGVLLVASGVYIIGMRRIDMQELWRPVRAMRTDRGTQFAFLTLLSVALYSIVDKMAVMRMHPVLFAYLYPWISLSLFTLYLKKNGKSVAIKQEWRGNRRAILICGVLSIFGYFLILLAFSIERVSYIVGLRQLSIVFAVMLGGHFLKEGNRRIRLAAAAIIFGGAYLIAVAG